MLACENIGRSVEECFPEVMKTSNMSKGGVKPMVDYELTRYACYLIVRNGDPRKEVIEKEQMARLKAKAKAGKLMLDE